MEAELAAQESQNRIFAAYAPVNAFVTWTGPNGQPVLASAGNDGTVRRWNAITGASIGGPLVGHTGWVWALTSWTDPEGRRILASAGGDGTVRRWDAITGNPIDEPLTGHSSGVFAL